MGPGLKPVSSDCGFQKSEVLIRASVFTFVVAVVVFCMCPPDIWSIEIHYPDHKKMNPKTLKLLLPRNLPSGWSPISDIVLKRKTKFL